MGYAPAYPGGWKNSPDTSTPITAAALQNMETGIESALPASGGTMTGPLSVAAAGSTGAVSPPPYGYGNSASPTGLVIGSSHPSDDVAGGTDGTGRISLYSYQRANAYSFGETIRNFLMRWDSKAMTAWYGPAALYDANGDAVTSGGWRPWTWVGSHYEANDHASVHGHWEVEVPDSAGALQGRFSVLFADPSSGAVGLDRSIIGTNLADMHVNCHGTDHSGAYQQQYLRLTGQAGFAKALEWNNDNGGSQASRRWQLAANAAAESGSNAGTDFTLSRFDDAGNLLGTPVTVTRSTGGITLGSASASAGVTVVRAGGTGLTVAQSGAAATGVQVTSADTSSVACAAMVSGDSSNRLQVLSTGQLNWGPGNAAADANLYRSSAGVVKTDGTFHVGTTLRLNTTSLGGGSGVVAIGNATVNPSANPSGGGVLYASGGALLWRGSNGTVTTIASA